MVCLAYHFRRLLSKVKVDATIFNVAQIERLQVTAAQVCQATCKDAVLSKVLQYTQHGWPTDVASDLVPFKNRAQELCIEDHCILWGARVVVPVELQQRVLDELHDTHPRITRKKAIV